MTLADVLVLCCKHKFIFDAETSEAVCEMGCGWAVPIYENKALAYAPNGRKLTSPSVKDQNLGSDQNETIRTLGRGGTDYAGKPARRYLQGALRFLPDSRSGVNEDIIVSLSDRLHGRVADDVLAEIAAVARKGLAEIDRASTKRKKELIDSIVGPEA